MNRFRKRSDPRVSQVPESLRVSAASTQNPPGSLPALPPPSDFRTSLILPDLSRRFTLLRSSSGDPVPLDDFRSKFAEQRARGGFNALSIEEEDMILETLGRLRAKASTSSATTNSSTGGDSGYNLSSARTSDATTASYSSLRTSTKRYSNNLFGSGRFRDQTYFRTAAQERKRAGSANEGGRSAVSVASSSSSPQTDSPNAEESANAEGGVAVAATLERTLSKIMARDQLPRASMALDEVIREIEEEVGGDDDEGDDKVLVPRSPVDARGMPRMQTFNGSSSVNDFETGTAFSADHPVGDSRTTPSPHPRSNNASPTPRLPGYVPGMQRPMTPRDFTFEPDDTSNASTPRATSPRLSASERESPISVSLLRRESYNRHGSPLSTSVQFVSRPLNGRRTPDNVNQQPSFEKPDHSGRFTPQSTMLSMNSLYGREDSDRSLGDSFMDFGTSRDSTVLDDRRPRSPGSPNVYQSVNSGRGSRPGTPSNVTWKLPTSSGHSRNGSAVSSNQVFELDTSVNGQTSKSILQHGHIQNGNALGSSGPVPERTVSPAFRSSQSSLLPSAHSVDNANPYASFPIESTVNGRTSSLTSGLELSSPVALAGRTLHTPTHLTNEPPNSPSFLEFDYSHSRVNSRAEQHSLRQGTSSPFNLNQSHTLLLSPMANSSRSSLESTGSSYHTLDENKQDRLLPLFAALQSQHPAWHDLSNSDRSSSSRSSGDMTEDAIQQYAGLTKNDIVAIQERLVFVANARAEASEARERKNSLRRRRPSMSQPVPVKTEELTTTSDVLDTLSRNISVNVSKANALLDSVIDSIASPSQDPLQPVSEKQKPYSPTDSAASTPTRRRRAALAEALFGSSDFDQYPESQTVLPQLASSNGIERSLSPAHADAQQQNAVSTPPSVENRSISPTFLDSVEGNVADVALPVMDKPEQGQQLTTQVILDQQASSTSSASTVNRSPNMPTPKLPISDPKELALEVQRRADVATALLKQNPSVTNLSETSPHIGKKRIDPSQISKPHLTWASTSVDTIPLPQPSMGSSSPSSLSTATGSKLGFRLRKLRGTLRAKPIPTGEEISPYTLMTPTSAQSAFYDPSHLSPPSPNVAQDLHIPADSRTRPIIVTPPASAGPGLKSFMSRFRKSRLPDTSEQERDRTRSVNDPRSYLQTQRTGTGAGFSSPAHIQVNVTEVRSAPPTELAFRGLPSVPDASTTKSATSPQSDTTANAQAKFDATLSPQALSRSLSARSGEDNAALKQLFDAAQDLGLDQNALSDLIARSPSLSTKNPSTTKGHKRVSNAQSLAPTWIDPSRSASPQAASTRATSPAMVSGRPSLEQSVRQPPESVQTNEPLSRLPTRRQVRPKSPGADGNRNTVIRRTIIMPSELRELRQSTVSVPPSPPPAVSRKPSARRRRSASTTSALSSSVHDRAPTPPPPKSPTGTRFLTDSSPPVPQMPNSFMRHAEFSGLLPLQAPPLLEKSNSTYDSLYDMYTGDSRVTNFGPDDPDSAVAAQGLDVFNNLEPGAAVEVLEMANGETIWSIVNGLRDDMLDPEDSFYGNRASFLSEYSLRDDEGVQVYYKEHSRKTSKDSANSFTSRRKTYQSPRRPETKVFYSSPAQIGKLIDNLSQGLGMESGSFNVVPGLPGNSRLHNTTQHSYHSESSANLTVEERIDRMLMSTSGH